MSKTPNPTEATALREAALGRSPLGGKKTATTTVRMTDDMKLDLDRAAHELSMSTSEYVERLLAVALYGIDHVLKSERMRTEMVCGLFANTERKGTP